MVFLGGGVVKTLGRRGNVGGGGVDDCPVPPANGEGGASGGTGVMKTSGSGPAVSSGPPGVGDVNKSGRES